MRYWGVAIGIGVLLVLTGYYFFINSSSIPTDPVELVSFSSSACNNTINSLSEPLVEPDVIYDKQTKTSNITLSDTATCCLYKHAELTQEGSDLYLSVSTSGEPCKCTCAYTYSFALAPVDSKYHKIYYRDELLQTK